MCVPRACVCVKPLAWVLSLGIRRVRGTGLAGHIIGARIRREKLLALDRLRRENRCGKQGTCPMMLLHSYFLELHPRSVHPPLVGLETGLYVCMYIRCTGV